MQFEATPIANGRPDRDKKNKSPDHGALHFINVRGIFIERTQIGQLLPISGSYDGITRQR